jgi:cytochrome c2
MAKRKESGIFVAVAMGIVGIAIIVAGFERMRESALPRPYRDVPGGDVERGRKALLRYKCGSCHIIPGIEGGDGKGGQSLAGLALRFDIVGALPNTPEDVARWIRDPKAAYPQTTMPNLNVSHRDSIDMVAYLYALPP